MPATRCVKMSSFYDSKIFKDGSAKIKVKSVRCQNWLELVLDQESQVETLMIKTDSLEEARRVAEYNFFMSANVVVARW